MLPFIKSKSYRLHLAICVAWLLLAFSLQRMVGVNQFFFPLFLLHLYLQFLFSSSSLSFSFWSSTIFCAASTSFFLSYIFFCRSVAFIATVFIYLPVGAAFAGSACGRICVVSAADSNRTSTSSAADWVAETSCALLSS